MSLPEQMKRRRRADRELEVKYNIAKNDPLAQALGGRRYSQADVEALEEEMVPWLRRARRRARDDSR